MQKIREYLFPIRKGIMIFDALDTCFYRGFLFLLIAYILYSTHDGNSHLKTRAFRI